MKLIRASMDDCLVLSLAVHGPGHAIADHFTLVEFACRDGSDNVWVHPWLMHGLDMLRRDSGAPVVLTNGFRTVRHNAKVGGAKRSKHLYGMAADVVSRAWSPEEVAGWAEVKGFGGIGRYNTFTHLDVYGEGRRWIG